MDLGDSSKGLQNQCDLGGDIHICGACKQQFTDVEVFFIHKRQTCPVLFKNSLSAKPQAPDATAQQQQQQELVQKFHETSVHQQQQTVVSANQKYGIYDPQQASGGIQHVQVLVPEESMEDANEDSTADAHMFTEETQTVSYVSNKGIVTSQSSEYLADSNTCTPDNAKSNHGQQVVMVSSAQIQQQSVNPILYANTNDGLTLKQNVVLPAISQHISHEHLVSQHTQATVLSPQKQLPDTNTEMISAEKTPFVLGQSIHADNIPNVNMASLVGVQPRTVNITPDVSLITTDNLPSALQAALQSGNVQVLTASSVTSPTKSGQAIQIAKLVPKVRSPPAKKFHCSVENCNFTTAYHKDLERHSRTHTGERPFSCDVCSRTFNRRDKLKIHLRGHTGNKPYKCESCDYAAADSSSLKKHMRIHTDERPFKCQICPYASRNSSQLIVHLRTHTGDAPFQCQMCQAKFKINSDLKRHMRMHTGEKPYSCEFCNYKCAIKGNLKSHYRINHSKENLLNCNQCSYQASSRKAFKEHFKTHEIEKPVSCTQCNYTCVNRAALKAHMKIHSESRPYKCEFCAYMSRQSGNVRTHMKKKHADKLKLKKTAIHLDQAPSIDAKKELKRQKGWPLVRKAFKCDLCEASFVRDDSLRSHKRQHRELSQVLESTAMAVLQLQHPITNINGSESSNQLQAQQQLADEGPEPMLMINEDHEEESDDVQQSAPDVSETSQILQSALIQSNITPTTTNQTVSHQNMQTNQRNSTGTNQSGGNAGVVHVAQVPTRSSMRSVSVMDQQAANLLAYAQNNRNKAMEENMQNAAISNIQASSSAATHYTSAASYHQQQHHQQQQQQHQQRKADKSDPAQGVAAIYSNNVTVSMPPTQQLASGKAQHSYSEPGVGVVSMDENAAAMQIVRISNQLGQVQSTASSTSSPVSASSPVSKQTYQNVSVSSADARQVYVQINAEGEFVRQIVKQGVPQAQQQAQQHQAQQHQAQQQQAQQQQAQQQQAQPPQQRQVNVTHFYAPEMVQQHTIPQPSTSSSSISSSSSSSSLSSSPSKSHEHLIRQLQKPRVDLQISNNSDKSIGVAHVQQQHQQQQQQQQILQQQQHQMVAVSNHQTVPSNASSSSLADQVSMLQAAVFGQPGGTMAAHNHAALLTTQQQQQHTQVPLTMPFFHNGVVTSAQVGIAPNTQISLPMAEPQTSERSVSVQTTSVTTAPPPQPVHHQAVHQHDGSVVQAAPALQTVQYLVPTSDNSNTASAVAAAGSGIQFAHANISGQNVIIQVVTPQPYADTAGAAPINLPHNVVQDLLRVFAKSKSETAAERENINENIDLPQQPITTVDMSMLTNQSAMGERH